MFNADAQQYPGRTWQQPSCVKALSVVTAMAQAWNISLEEVEKAPLKDPTLILWLRKVCEKHVSDDGRAASVLKW